MRSQDCSSVREVLFALQTEEEDGGGDDDDDEKKEDA